MAESEKNSSEELERVEQALRLEGVKDEDIEKLINKLVNGELWDSMDPLYEELKPQIISNNYSKTIYPDGSIKIVIIEEISGEYGPRTIWNRQGYKVYQSWVLVSLGFKVDYERDDEKKVGRITSQYSYEVNTLLGTYEEDTKGHLYGWHNPTNAWYSVNYTAIQNAGAKRYFVKIFVDGDGTWEDSTQ